MQQNIDALNLKIKDAQDLIDEWDQKRMVADNPTEIKRCDNEINRLQNLKNGYEEELRQLLGKTPLAKQASLNKAHPSDTSKHEDKRRKRKFKPWQIVLALGVILGLPASIAGFSGYTLKDIWGMGPRPRTLTIYVHGPENRQQYLIENEGELVVDFGDRRDRRNIGEAGRTNFGEIPERLWGKRIGLGLTAKGYELVNPDSTYLLDGEPIYVAVKKDNSLGVIRGMVQSRNGQEFLEGAMVRINTDTIVQTDEFGNFKIVLPEEMQVASENERYRLTISKEGYDTKTYYYTPNSSPADIRLEKL